MIDFTDRDKTALLWMFDYIKEHKLSKANEEQRSNFENLENKVKLALDHDIVIDLTTEDFEQILESQVRLDELCRRFYNSPEELDPHVYDHLQRDILSELDYYITLKEKFKAATDYLKEAVTKEAKARISSDLVMEDKISQAQANIQVERDLRYTTMRNEYLKIKNMYSKVLSRYNHYSSTQKAVMQALSLSGKYVNQKRD